MYQQERMDEIMRILRKNHYVTVDYLVNEIKYSSASIRRDLTLLQKQGLVKRSYGGVSLRNESYTPFRFRQHSMKTAKNAIAKKAASLVKDGDVVFIDSNTTAQYVGHYLINKKGITVVTSNMTLATYMYEHGIQTFCTGGRVVEYPGALGGELTYHGFSMFNADIAFFSSGGIDADGNVIATSETDYRRIGTLREHSKKLVYLCGSDKFDSSCIYRVASMDDVDYFISDALPHVEIRDKHKNTKFLRADV